MNSIFVVFRLAAISLSWNTIASVVQNSGEALVPVIVAPHFSLHEHLGPLNSLGFVKEARRNTKHLPGVVFDALMDFKIDPPAAGAIVISNLTLGVVSPTPSLPGTNHSSGALTSEMVAVTISELLGHAVGYAPEHNGDIVQNIMPVPGQEDYQTSLSSSTRLMWHTETAFAGPLRPRYSGLLCKRGQAEATTWVASLAYILPHLSVETIAELRKEQFKTGIDHSFMKDRFSPGAENQMTKPLAVLSGEGEHMVIVYDEDLMIGLTSAANSTLLELQMAINRAAVSVVLESGDMIVIDNYKAVHARGSFTPVFGDEARWLQRVFIMSELDSYAPYLNGRIMNKTY